MLPLIPLLLSSAFAGEIVVSLQSPVLVFVDGRPLGDPGSDLQIVARDLITGSHNVVIRDLIGRQVTSMQVDLTDSEQVWLSYINKTLSETSRVPLPAAVIPAAAAAPAAAGVPAVGAVNVNINIGGMGGAAVAAAPAAPPAPAAMSESALQSLLAAVESASFSDDKVGVIATAAKNNYFTCAQLSRLIASISFSDDKVAAVSAARAAIIDPENAYVLESSFSFSSDREKVRALF